MCRRVNFIVYIGSSASTTVFKACLATHLVINKMFKNFNKLNLIAKYFPVGEKVVGCFYNIDLKKMFNLNSFQHQSYFIYFIFCK